MKKQNLAIALILSAAALAGCGDEPKTVDYYKANIDDAKEAAAECKNKGISPLADTPDARNCMAAMTAIREHRIEENKGKASDITIQPFTPYKSGK